MCIATTSIWVNHILSSHFQEKRMPDQFVRNGKAINLPGRTWRISQPSFDGADNG